ncbi:hypothetical protein N1851_033750 [Merluccius polli]|uniref:CCHC-type domain-containing protein n=1 Tax=Merluccius polli TaxID=89951 RepID=A0AA47M0Y2_MERPO|nr:hypothetical protein N1851_033750 [Merluccius polli]
MQNADGAAATAQRDTPESMALLREAVLRLTQYAIRDSPTATPTSRLTKLGPDDDVEAYLEVFERTARRESWPEDQRAHILFLTGPAQQASQDISAETARQYPALKQAILAYYGHNLAARAHRFHDWRFDIRGPVRAQIAQHGRLVRRWLATGEGPSPLDRIQRILAHHHPDTVDDLIRQLENWQVAQQLSASPRTTPRPTETRRDRRGPTTSPQTPPPEPPIVAQEGREGRRCYTCGQTGHIARYCTGDRDVLMPSAYVDEGMRRPCMLATCLAQGMTGVPTIPARALLDTGSVVTLLRPDLAGGKEGDPMEVACVHGDTRTYGTCHVVIRTPYGVFTARAGIVPHLPVPLLIGRDCPIFHQLWNPERGPRARREPPRRGGRRVRPAYGATRVPATPGESTAEDQKSEGNGPSPPGSPIPTAGGGDRIWAHWSSGQLSPLGGPLKYLQVCLHVVIWAELGTTDTLTASERNDPPEGSESSPLTEFSDFLPAGGEGTARAGQFASAQLQDDALKHAWSHVLAHDGQTRESRFHQAVKECDNLLPTREIRGLVVEPLAGDREHHFPPHHQPDGEHLDGGRNRAGRHLKRRRKTHSGRERSHGPGGGRGN